MQISQNKHIGFSSSRIRLPLARLEKNFNQSLAEIGKVHTPEEKLEIKKKFIAKRNSLFESFKRLNVAIMTESERYMLIDAFHELSGFNGVIDSLFRDKYDIWKRFHKKHPELVNPFENNKVGFDQTCKIFFNDSVKCLKRYQMFLDRGLSSKTTPPRDIFQMALESVKETVKGKNISLEVKNLHLLEQNRPYFYNYKTYAVFSNLIGNAAKYTPENGKIEVDFLNKSHKDKKFLVMSVKDNGIGIPPEETEEAIYGLRASNAVESGIQGSGMGLNRVRKICETMYMDPIEIKSPLYPDAKIQKGTEIICPLAQID